MSDTPIVTRQDFTTAGWVTICDPTWVSIKDAISRVDPDKGEIIAPIGLDAPILPWRPLP